MQRPGATAGRTETGRKRAGRRRKDVPRKHSADTRHRHRTARQAGLHRTVAVRGSHRRQRKRVPDGIHRNAARPAPKSAEPGGKPSGDRLSGVGHVGLDRKIVSGATVL